MKPLADPPPPNLSEMGRRRITAKAEESEYYAERRSELINAAAALFKEKGFQETTLDDIARRAGVDRSSIYYYVSSKQEFFVEVMERAMTLSIQRLEEIRRQALSPQEMLRAVVVDLMVSYAENPFLNVYLQEGAAKNRRQRPAQLQRLAKLERRFEDLVVEIIQSGIDGKQFRGDIPAKLIANAIIGTVNWSHRWFNPKGAFSGRKIGEMFAQIALTGVLTADSENYKQ